MAVDPGTGTPLPIPTSGGVMSLQDAVDNFPEAVDRYGRTAGTLLAALSAWVTAENLTNVYRVRLMGNFSGRPISTTLYYQAYGLDLGTVAWGGSDDLAYQINQEVIPALTAATPSYVLWEKMQIDAVDGLGARLFTDTQEYTIQNGQGQRGGQPFDLDDHGLAWHLEATLAPFPLTASSLFGLTPKSGRLYIPGAYHSDVDGDRYAKPLAAMDSLASVLAQDLQNAVPPIVYVPARVRIITLRVPLTDIRIRVWGASTRVTAWQVMPRLVHLDKRS